MTAKVQTTWVVEVRSPHRSGAYGTNQDYYFRSEIEAKREAAELRRWYGPKTTQTIKITSHTL